MPVVTPKPTFSVDSRATKRVDKVVSLHRKYKRQYKQLRAKQDRMVSQSMKALTKLTEHLVKLTEGELLEYARREYV